MNTKQITNTIKAISKIMKEQAEHPTLEDIKDKQIGILDESNCLMIISKSLDMKDLTKIFIDKNADEHRQKIPELVYDGEGVCKYGADFLKLAVNVFIALEENPILSIKKDYPITLESDSVKIIIAPRIDY